MERAVFLDRDGVVNRAVVVRGKSYPPSSLADLEILPGVPKAINSIKAAGFRVIVATNQPDVGTGKQQRWVVEVMHDYLKAVLAIDAIYVCYHTDADRCPCRKPLPGMLVDAAQQWKLDLSQSFMVGDRWRDIEAGQHAGCRTFWVRDQRYQEKEPEQPNWMVGSLLEASEIICSARHPCHEGMTACGQALGSHTEVA